MWEDRMTFNDVARMLNVSFSRLILTLKSKNIILNTNGRNIPTQPYIDQRWFTVKYKPFERDGFKAVVPLVRITKTGLFAIQGIIEKERFSQIQCTQLFKQVANEINEFMRGHVLELFHEIVEEESENGWVEIYYKTDREADLILKYKKGENVIWLPKSVLKN